ncbi:hypothetical protein Tco_0696513 [Tanacetum coccineum]
MEIVQDEEEITIDAIPLATKPPMIVEYKIVKEGQKGFYHLIRANVMFELDIKSEVWRSLQGYKVTVWKLFDNFTTAGVLTTAKKDNAVRIRSKGHIKHPSDTKVFIVKMEILPEPASNKLIVGDPQIRVTPTKNGRMTKPYSSTCFIANSFNAGYLKMDMEQKLNDQIYENNKLRAQLKGKFFESQMNHNGTSMNTKLSKPSTSGTKLYSVTLLPKSKVTPKVVEKNDLSKSVTSHLTTNKITKKCTKVLAPGLLKIESEPINVYYKNTRAMHRDYLKVTKEHVATLQARALKPLDEHIGHASKFAEQIQELLMYVSASCPFTSKRE